MKYSLSIIIALTFLSCNQKFDKDLWIKNKSQSSDNPRFEMVKDLKQNYLLQGTSSNTVLKLLGKPENIDTSKFGIHWTYSIGSNPGFNIDPYYLSVKFNLKGRLANTKIIEH